MNLEGMFIDLGECPGRKTDGLLGDVLWDDVCWHSLRDCLCRDARDRETDIGRCGI